MRYCLFPIEHMDIWKAYKQHMHAFWTAEEIDFTTDRVDWETRLTPDERFFIENMLAFFAGSDGIVLENLVQNFCKEIEIPEARCFYAFQAMMENIHCVSGDTLVYTEEWGDVPIEKIVNQSCHVWNGKEFSETTIKFTGNQELFRVRLVNTMELKCTKGHVWYILGDENNAVKKLETQDLAAGMQIAPFHYPDGRLIDDTDKFIVESIKQWTINNTRVFKTYCFNEPKEHKGLFNGILTGQSEAYSLMIDTFVKEPKRKQELFDAIECIPCVQKKAQWAIRWISNKNNESLTTRLFAFGIVEGVFFSGAFCAIFWLKERGLLVNSLGKSNEWIARDEGLHTQFAVIMYHKLNDPIPEQKAHIIMKDAVDIETEFILESIPVRLIGMNQDSMKQYIRFVADRLLSQFGFSRLYNVENPFPFMEKIGLDGKTNFFEQRVSEYSRISDYNGNKNVDSAFTDMDQDIF